METIRTIYQTLFFMESHEQAHAKLTEDEPKGWVRYALSALIIYTGLKAIAYIAGFIYGSLQ